MNNRNNLIKYSISINSKNVHRYINYVLHKIYRKSDFKIGSIIIEDAYSCEQIFKLHTILSNYMDINFADYLIVLNFYQCDWLIQDYDRVNNIFTLESYTMNDKESTLKIDLTNELVILLIIE